MTEPVIVPPGQWRVYGSTADPPECFIPDSPRPPLLLTPGQVLRMEGGTNMGHGLKGVTVQTFRDTLLSAASHLDAVQPVVLREPLALWFRATEERAIREGWHHLLGRDVVAVWNAARAVLGQAADE